MAWLVYLGAKNRRDGVARDNGFAGFDDTIEDKRPTVPGRRPFYEKAPVEATLELMADRCC